MVSMTAACRIGICVAVARGVGSFASSARVILPVHEISVLVSDIVILLPKLIQFQQNPCLLATSRSPSLPSEVFMTTIRAAFYARVSSEQQATAHTIESQTAALSERAQSDGTPVPPERQFVDDGYSGATLIRPGLDRLRDLATVGAIDRIYVHSPDRLARNYAYQVLLLDEWRRRGVEVVFLNRPLGQSPEDDLLLQVQGIVALFRAAHAQLEENRSRARLGRRRPGYLLQGLTCCARCGYAYYGKTTRQLGSGRQMKDFRYYRCSGSDGYRFGGERICSNAQVQGEFLEPAVWHEVFELLTKPERLEREYQDRSRVGPSLGNVDTLKAERVRLQHALERLIDSFTEGLIDKEQFTSRMDRTKSRIADLDAKIKADAGAVDQLEHLRVAAK